MNMELHTPIALVGRYIYVCMKLTCNYVFSDRVRYIIMNEMTNDHVVDCDCIYQHIAQEEVLSLNLHTRGVCLKSSIVD